LKLFDIAPEMMGNAQLVFGIQMLMIPIFCAQTAAMSMFISIGDTVRSNIAAVFQDIITFFPVLGMMYGITIATQNIWVLVCTYAVNAFISTILLTIYTI
jgi:fructose-specific phosphotransferase system IIC component